MYDISHLLDHIPSSISEAWRTEYRGFRSLDHIAGHLLRDRLTYLAENLITIEADGKEGVLPINASLWKTFVGTHEEALLRGLNISAVLDRAAIPEAEGPVGAALSAAYGRRKNKRDGQFFKFGKARFLKQLVEGGNLHIRPGSSYADPSLNSAVRDNELRLDLKPPSKHLQLTLPGGIVSAPGLVQNFEIRTDYDCEFYVWCLSNGLHNRLLADFEADCVVVIYDMTEFFRSVQEAIQIVLPGWISCFCPITYLDPYLIKWDQLPPLPLGKHHRYSYQNEWRFVFHPPQKVLPGELHPIDVQLKLEPHALELIIPR
jgi:hypothetical protein